MVRTAAQQEFIFFLELDPLEIIDAPLPDDLDIETLQLARAAALAMLQMLELNLHDSEPLIGKLAEINRRLAAARSAAS
jgi:hypothetical protein